MIDFWNGIHTPDGAVWFNRFTNEYEFEKRPDGFDAYLLGKRAYNMMSKFDINDIVTVPYDHDKKYWTVTAVRTSQIEMRAIYDLVSAKTGIALYDVPEVDMTLVKRPTQKKDLLWINDIWSRSSSTTVLPLLCIGPTVRKQ